MRGVRRRRLHRGEQRRQHAGSLHCGTGGAPRYRHYAHARATDTHARTHTHSPASEPEPPGRGRPPCAPPMLFGLRLRVWMPSFFMLSGRFTCNATSHTLVGWSRTSLYRARESRDSARCARPSAISGARQSARVNSQRGVEQARLHSSVEHPVIAATRSYHPLNKRIYYRGDN